MEILVSPAFSTNNLTAFMDDHRRCNLTMTRAKEVLWIIGGPTNGKNKKLLPPFAELKRELEKSGQVHHFGDHSRRHR